MLSGFYLRERIHNSVSVTRSSWKDKQMVLNKDIQETMSMPLLLCLLIHNRNTIMKLQNPCCIKMIHAFTAVFG